MILQSLLQTFTLLVAVGLVLPRGGDCGLLHEPHSCDRKKNTTSASSSSTAINNNNNNNNPQQQPVCEDTHKKCQLWAEEGECESNAVYMLTNCPCSCNSCPIYIQHEWDDEPQIAMGPLKEEIEWNIQQTVEYMGRFKRYFSFSFRNCRNKHKGCSHWSLLGECHFNPPFMLTDCAAACRQCHRPKKFI